MARWIVHIGFAGIAALSAADHLCAAAAKKTSVSVRELLRSEPSTISALVERTKIVKAAPSPRVAEKGKPLVASSLGKKDPAIGTWLAPKNPKFYAAKHTVKVPLVLPLKVAATKAKTRENVVDLGQFLKPKVVTPLANNQDSLPEEKEDTLSASFVSGALQVVPQRLEFQKLGQAINVVVPTSGGQVDLFVRDATIANYDPAQQQLTAIKTGTTELYLVGGGRMLIVPITVSTGSTPKALTIPQTLVSLNDLINQGANTPQAQMGGDQLPTPANEARSALPELSLNMPARESALAGAYGKGSENYALNDSHIAYKALLFKTMDSRSSADQTRIFPVAGIPVEVLGTEFRTNSDSVGHVAMTDVPSGSRFLVRVSDPTGQIRPSIVEVHATPSEGRQIVPIRVMNFEVFDAITTVLGIAQQADLASFCGTLLDANNHSAPLKDIQLTLNVEARGPYYFNDVGPDQSLAATSENGRFCFFNVQPGPAQIGIFSEQVMIGVTAVPLFAGSHLDDAINVANAPAFRTKLAVMPSAHEQLFSDDKGLHLGAFDSVDLTAIGATAPLEYLSSGVLGLPRGATLYNDRIYGHVDAAEFEPMLYSYSGEDFKNMPVTPLMPRGFLEEVFTELAGVDGQDSIAYDQSLGAIVVFHGQSEATRGKPVHVRVLDAYGQELEGGWFFGNEQNGLVKAVFFNVNPGIYSVIVENENRYWVAAETVVVDSWASSLVQTGAKISK